MLKTKKILSVLMALVMMLSALSVVASASSVADNVISNAEIVIDTDIAGVNAENYESYIEIITEGLEFEDNYDDPGVFVYDSEYNDFTGTFVDGETYTFYVYLSAESGYVLGDISSAVVNGLQYGAFVDCWYPNEELEVYYVTFSFNVTIGDDFNYTVVDTAEIEIDTDIAGLSVDDYYSYISIYTDGLEFEDNYNDPAVFVNDSEGNDFYGEFEAGETYYFSVYLSPEIGYYLAQEVTGYVNGEKVDADVGYWIPGEEYGDVQVDFVLLQYEITVTDGTEVEELGFFARIIEFFKNLFALIFGVIG